MPDKGYTTITALRIKLIDDGNDPTIYYKWHQLGGKV